MTVSELVHVLLTYQRVHGDHEVVDSYGQAVGEPEMVEGDCVLCDKA